MSLHILLENLFFVFRHLAHDIRPNINKVMPEWTDIPQILKVAINPIDSNLISNDEDVWDHPLIDSFVEKCNF